MQVLIGFLVSAFLVGGSAFGNRVRSRPIILLAATAVVATSFYSLRVIL